MRQEMLTEGSRVRLKSGGPLMTVECVGGEGVTAYARCAWFDQRQRPHAVNLAIVALELEET